MTKGIDHMLGSVMKGIKVYSWFGPISCAEPFYMLSTLIFGISNWKDCDHRLLSLFLSYGQKEGFPCLTDGVSCLSFYVKCFLLIHVFICLFLSLLND